MEHILKVLNSVTPPTDLNSLWLKPIDNGDYELLYHSNKQGWVVIGLSQDDIKKLLNSKGKFLSLWNSTTGKPVTNPEEIPYKYTTGEYYLVNKIDDRGQEEDDIYISASAESFDEEDITIENLARFKKRIPSMINDFVFTDVRISADTDSLIFISIKQFDYNALITLANQEKTEDIPTVVGIQNVQFYIYLKDNNTKIGIQTKLFCNCIDGTIHEVISTSNTKEVDFPADVQSRIAALSDIWPGEEFGVNILPKYYAEALGQENPDLLLFENTTITKTRDVYEGIRCLLNGYLSQGPGYYGISLVPKQDIVEGDEFYVFYSPKSVNYKPSGNSYTGEVSTVEETDDVKIGDAYVFDGTNWILQLNHNKIIPIDEELDGESTNPVENRAVASAFVGMAQRVTNLSNNKADKSTTLSGYGITDANINNGIITLGSQTITPVQAVSGKGLSTNDYTTAEKNKLTGIAAGAEANVQSDWNQTDTAADDFIKNKPDLTQYVTKAELESIELTIATALNNLNNRVTALENA